MRFAHCTIAWRWLVLARLAEQDAISVSSTRRVWITSRLGQIDRRDQQPAPRLLHDPTAGDHAQQRLAHRRAPQPGALNQIGFNDRAARFKLQR